MLGIRSRKDCAVWDIVRCVCELKLEGVNAVLMFLVRSETNFVMLYSVQLVA